MKYFFLVSLFIFMFISGCITTQQNENPGQSVYDIIITRANERYSIWKSNRDGSETQILFYGHEGDYRVVSSRTSGYGLASGWYQIIFYRNITNINNLSSITILGKYIGDPEKKWSFAIEDMNENVLYTSPEYNFSIFSSEDYSTEIFDAPVKNIPDEFIIKLTTRSNPENSLFIRHGGKHDWYENPVTGMHQPIPRYREINEKLAKNILKKLGIEN